MAGNNPIDDINEALSLANELAHSVKVAISGLIGNYPQPGSGALVKEDAPSGLLPNLAGRARGTRENMMGALQELNRLRGAIGETDVSDPREITTLRVRPDRGDY